MPVNTDFGLAGVGVEAVTGGFSHGSGRASDRSSRRHEAAIREDSAIQRRVADAKKAGVHPLYALGANVQTGQWSGGSGSVGKRGVNVLRGMSAAVRSQRKGGVNPQDAAQLRLLSSQTDYYDALTQKALSDVARVGQSQSDMIRLARPGGHQYFGEDLPSEGGVRQRRVYPSYWGNLEYSEGVPTGEQAEDVLGEGGGTVDSFLYYLQAIGKRLGIVGSRRQELARKRVNKRFRSFKRY